MLSRSGKVRSWCWLARLETRIPSPSRAFFYGPSVLRGFRGNLAGMVKPLQIFWSLAAFEACKPELDSVQSFALAGVGDLAAKMDGWFFHSFVTPNNCLLRCDAYPEPDAWRVYVRTAELVGEPIKMPVAINSPENEKFAEFGNCKSTYRDDRHSKLSPRSKRSEAAHRPLAQARGAHHSNWSTGPIRSPSANRSSL